MRISDWSSDVCSSDLLAAMGRRLAHEIQRAGEQRNRLRKIDDVHAVAVADDVRLHPRIPAMRLVTVMGARSKSLRHGDDRFRHILSPYHVEYRKSVFSVPYVSLRFALSCRRIFQQ